MCPAGPVPLRHLAQEAVGRLQGAGWVAAVEGECGQDGLRVGERLDLLQQRVRLVEPALPTAQLREPKDGLGCLWWTRVQLCAGAEQFLLSLRPLPSRGEHAGVVGVGRSRTTMPARVAHKILHPQAPLGGAVDVARAFASRDHAAAGQRDQLDVAHLAAGGRGGRFVQSPHAAADLALGYQRDTLQGAGQHLEVEQVEPRGGLDGVLRVLSRGARVVAHEDGVQRLLDREEGVLWAGCGRSQEPLRSLHPPVEDGRLVAEEQRVFREVQGHSRGPEVATAVAVELERALAGREQRGDVVQPPARPPEPLERVGTLDVLQDLLEPGSSGLPLALRQGVLTCCQQIHRPRLTQRRDPHPQPRRTVAVATAIQLRPDRRRLSGPAGRAHPDSSALAEGVEVEAARRSMARQITVSYGWQHLIRPRRVTVSSCRTIHHPPPRRVPLVRPRTRGMHVQHTAAVPARRTGERQTHPRLSRHPPCLTERRAAASSPWPAATWAGRGRLRADHGCGRSARS